MFDDSIITHAIKSYYSQTFTENGLDPKNMWTSLSYFLSLHGIKDIFQLN